MHHLRRTPQVLHAPFVPLVQPAQRSKQARFAVLFLLCSAVAFVLTALNTAQSLAQPLIHVLNMDTSRLRSNGTLRAQFIVIDERGDLVRPVLPNNLAVFENADGAVNRVFPGNMLQLRGCPAMLSQPPANLSLAISFDISGSMVSSVSGQPLLSLELARRTADSIVARLNLPQSEVAIQWCNTDPMIVQDFTGSRLNVLRALASPNDGGGGNDFVTHLLNGKAGLIPLAQSGKGSPRNPNFKRVALLLTDAFWGPMKNDEIERAVALCQRDSIRFFAVLFGPSLRKQQPRNIAQSFEEIARRTGGKIYEGVQSSEDVSKMLQDLRGNLALAASSEACEVEWRSPVQCFDELRSVMIQYSHNGQTTQMQPLIYRAQAVGGEPLRIAPGSIYFRVPSIRGQVDTTQRDTLLTFTAPMTTDYTILNIQSDPATDPEGKFSFELVGGARFPLRVPRGESRVVRIKYTPTDDFYRFARFIIRTDVCDRSVFVAAGTPGRSRPAAPLTLVHPNGGERFGVGSDTVVTWRNIPATDRVQLSYSVDSGTTWDTLTNDATGLRWAWRNVPDRPSNRCLMRVRQFDPSVQARAWQATGEFIDITTRNYSPSRVRVALFDDTGNRIFTASEAMTAGAGTGIQMWRTGASLSEPYSSVRDLDVLNSGTPVSMALSPPASTRRVVVVTEQGDASTFSYQGNATQFTAGIQPLRIPASVFSSVVFHPTIPDRIIVAYRDASNSRTVIEFYNLVGNAWQRDNAVALTDSANATVRFSTAQLSPDGRQVAAAGDDGVIRVWEFEPDGSIVRQNRPTFTLTDPALQRSMNRRLTSLSFDQTGSLLVSGGDDGIGRVWDVVRRSPLVTLNGHTAKINSANFANGGDVIVTASDDGTARIWSVFDGRQIGRSFSHTQFTPPQPVPVLSAALSPDRAALLTGFESLSSRQSGIPIQVGARLWRSDLFPPILQEDVSDTLWSIVRPEGFANNVNMGNVVEGSFRDSTVVAFVTNTSSVPLTITNVSLLGPDASASGGINPPLEYISLPSFVIPPNSSQALEFRFRPNRTGNFTAQIQLTTSRNTVLQTRQGMLPIITGNGLPRIVEVIADSIDFGQVAIGSLKDTNRVAVLRNVGTTIAEIQQVVLPNALGPDRDQFSYQGTINAGNVLTLRPGDTLFSGARFAPVRLGRTTSRIGFRVNNMPEMLHVLLIGEGIENRSPQTLASVTTATTISQPPVPTQNPLLSLTLQGCDTRTTTAQVALANQSMNTLRFLEGTRIEGDPRGMFRLLPPAGDSIAAGRAEWFGVAFAGQPTIGVTTATLVLRTNARDFPELRVPIIARRDSMGFRFEPTTVAFPAQFVGESTTATLLLRNTGQNVLDFTNPPFPRRFGRSGLFQIVNIQPPVIASGATAQVTVRFVGNPTPGQFADNETVSYENCATAPLTLTATTRLFPRAGVLAATARSAQGVQVRLVCQNAGNDSVQFVNTGELPLTITRVQVQELSVGDAAHFDVRAVRALQNRVLQPAATSRDTLTLPVLYRPTATGLRRIEYRVEWTTSASTAANPVLQVLSLPITAQQDLASFRLLRRPTVAGTQPAPFDVLAFISPQPNVVLFDTVLVENTGTLPLDWQSAGVAQMLPLRLRGFVVVSLLPTVTLPNGRSQLVVRFEGGTFGQTFQDTLRLNYALPIVRDCAPQAALTLIGRIGERPRAALALDSTQHRPGDTVQFRLRLFNRAFAGARADSVTFTLSYNATMLLPMLEPSLSQQPNGSVADGMRRIALNVPISDDTTRPTALLRFRAALGNNVSTRMELSNGVLHTSVGSVPIDTLNNGLFTLRGVSLADGTRLVNSTSAVLSAITIQPQPAQAGETVVVEYDASRPTAVDVSLTTVFGEPVQPAPVFTFDPPAQAVSTQRNRVSFSTMGITPGVYFVNIRSALQAVSRRVVIIR
jgi:WD40 repeat protein